MKSSEYKVINRRSFFKKLGTGAMASATLAGCGSKGNVSDADLSEIPTDRMTYRENPKTGEKVSILGYGCMRWPTIGGGSARDEDGVIDQEAVNRLVDYAIEHGVNYFDTSPAYCKGLSERATGIALKRHPRDEFFIATKLSNFSPDTWSREASLRMYHNSFKELQVDYIDTCCCMALAWAAWMR